MEVDEGGLNLNILEGSSSVTRTYLSFSHRTVFLDIPFDRQYCLESW
jgi:hypothetical protein